MKKDLLVVVPGFELDTPKLEELPNLHSAKSRQRLVPKKQQTQKLRLKK